MPTPLQSHQFTLSVKAYTMSKAVAQAKSQVYLDQLDLDVTGPIVAMVCKKWDINDAIGRYLSTNFLIYDSKVLFLKVNETCMYDSSMCKLTITFEFLSRVI